MQEEIILSKTKQGESLIPAFYINIRDQKTQQKTDFVDRERGKGGKEKNQQPPHKPFNLMAADLNVQSCFSRARFLLDRRRAWIPSPSPLFTSHSDIIGMGRNQIILGE